MRRLILAAAAVLPLAGCHDRPVLAVPGELLHCSGRPAVPSRQGRTQLVVAGYVSDLADAHGDCHDKLGAVREIVEGTP
ncbi:hypothetical protein HCU64_00040 [Methylobacterium sp. C25]|uniref:hypothetical protein n=1 Tax=Methylobacterium sp. C25 TaxID=2721622 RepID=UPI001F1951B1|nr:hypothetical protein [Methylobacterium sp. C25]MCE4222128.1 hypothetical protein [Methylobacterium sp. C25]